MSFVGLGQVKFDLDEWILMLRKIIDYLEGILMQECESQIIDRKKKWFELVVFFFFLFFF